MKSLTWSNISIIRLGQECLWRLCVILPVISARWTAISYFCMLPGGEKCQNYLALHLCCNTPTWWIRAWTWSMSLCPRSLGEMRNLCGVQSIHKHPTHPLKSDCALKKSNFVKQRIMRGAEGWGAGIERPWSHSASPSYTWERHLLLKIMLMFHTKHTINTLLIHTGRASGPGANRAPNCSWTLYVKDLNHIQRSVLS